MYERWKRKADAALSITALIVLSPLFVIIGVWIKRESKGPVFFKQKRIGKDKTYFEIWKFRTMRTDTPRNCPTHLLANPEKYITKAGAFLRRTSLDELPQLINIARGEMSFVGPRPALWNQYDLIEERDKYRANGVRPGLTGYAQIHGRDELDIKEKARLDGYYVKHQSLWLDLRCILQTIGAVLKSRGVVEGGTGAMQRSEKKETKKICTQEGTKKILITGKDSYIGEAVKHWLLKTPGRYAVDTLKMRGEEWNQADFSGYDAVFHVAGIAHADTGKVGEEQKRLYYDVNTKLAIRTAKKAKREGAGQFILMSSMIVYGESGGIGERRSITPQTKPKPSNVYGHSKWLADREIGKLADGRFRVAILRPPMIYGKGSKGNFPILVKLAEKLPLFPELENERSMLYIENLCEFVRLVIENRETGVFFPQNREYGNTSEIVRIIGESVGKRIGLTKKWNGLIRVLGRMGGRAGKMAKKAFGNMVYEKEMSVYDKGDYQVCGLKESIRRTVGL